MRTKREIPARPLVERGERDSKAKRIGIALKQNNRERLFTGPEWTEAAKRRLAGCLWR